MGLNYFFELLTYNPLIYTMNHSRFNESIQTKELIGIQRMPFDTVKPVLNGQSKRPKIVFQDQLSFNAGQKYCIMLHGEHSAICSTFIKETRSVTMNIFSKKIFSF